MKYSNKRITTFSLPHLLAIVEKRKTYQNGNGNIIFISKGQITRGMAISEIGKVFLEEDDHSAEQLLLGIMIYIQDVSHICYFYLSQRKEKLTADALSFLERFEKDSLNISIINNARNIQI